MKLFHKLFLLSLLVCFIVQQSLAQFPKQCEISIIPGYATFSAHKEQGMSLAGEFTYKFNRWVNPSLRISSASGFNSVEEGLGAYHANVNTLSINANVDLFNPSSKHLFQLGGGPVIAFDMNSRIIGSYYVQEVDRYVNENVAFEMFSFSLGYFVRYKYRISDHFLLGLEWSETGLLTTGWVKQSALSFTFSALIL
ncbi:MAG: hypothetical protein JW798_01585 [Prolixibacteraceae bacterium]|nr:hypothetical protein [Prolixibacteraceae bacterium]